MMTERVAALREGGSGIPIEVRVLRKWSTRFQSGDLCFMLIDKYGDVIQAVSRGEEQTYTNPRLQTLNCYRIENYVCVPLNTRINVVTHPINIRIGQGATIEPLPDTGDIPNQHFEFRDYETLHTICGHVDTFTDYVGILRNINTDRTTRKGDPMASLTLMDARHNRIDAILWKETVTSPERLNRDAITIAEHPAVVALTSMRVTDYPGRLQLSGTPATYVYINPPDESTPSLLLSERHQISTGIPHTPQDVGRFFSYNPINNKVTLSTLTSMDRDDMLDRTFICNASVIAFLPNSQWYYNACPTCGSMVYESGNKWACPKHSSKFDIPSHMYRLNVKIADATGTAIAVVFNEAAKSLVDIECSELVLDKGYEDRTSIPGPVEKIKGKTRLFHLRLQRETRPDVYIFAVNRISNTQLENNVQQAPITPVTPTTTSPTASSDNQPNAQQNGPKRSLIHSPGGSSEIKRTRFPK